MSESLFVVDPTGGSSPPCLHKFPQHYNNDDKLFQASISSNSNAGRGRLCNIQAACQKPSIPHHSTVNVSFNFSDFNGGLFSSMVCAAIDKCIDERYQRLPTMSAAAAVKSTCNKITSLSGVSRSPICWRSKTNQDTKESNQGHSDVVNSTMLAWLGGRK